MRPAEYTAKQIIQAGQELEAAGRTVTGFAIRQKLGGGTQARLRQVWEEHKATTGSSQAAPASELPAEVAEVIASVSKSLSDRLMSLAIELNDKAVKAAKREVQEVVHAAGEQRELAEKELTDASQTVEDLEAQLDQAKNDLVTFQGQFANLQALHQAQAVDLAQVKERLAMVDQAAKVAAEQHTAEVTELRQLAQASTAERDDARTALQKVSLEVAEVKGENKTLSQAVKRHLEDLTKANKERDTALESHHKLQGQHEATQAQVADLMKTLTAQQAAKKTAEPKAPSSFQPKEAQPKPTGTKSRKEKS